MQIILTITTENADQVGPDDEPLEIYGDVIDADASRGSDMLQLEPFGDVITGYAIPELLRTLASTWESGRVRTDRGPVPADISELDKSADYS